MADFKKHVLMFLRGLLMGTADAIPGVSGGTIALITNIYSRLISGINDINVLLLKEASKLKCNNLFKNLRKIDFALFVPLLLGIGIAIVSLSHLMDYLLTKQTSITYAFFFGLILSSAFFVYKQSDKRHWRNLPFLVVGFLAAFLIVSLNALSASHSSLIILVSGAIAICAMILPGISGAFILVLLNQYEFMISAVKNLMIDKLLIFMLGAVIGILSFSKLLNFLLKRYKGVTMAFLTGLMIGSLRLPYEKVLSVEFNLFAVVIALVVGFVLVLLLEKKFASASK